MSLPGKRLLSATTIKNRVEELAGEITAHYNAPSNLPSAGLTVVGLMNGSIFFLVDLVRQLPPQTAVETWRVASYEGRSSTGKVSGLDHLTGDYKGKHVLIVDDILDTGVTLSEVKIRVKELGAKSIKVCVLLSKKKKRARQVKAHWVGFDIEDSFVIGYGLDLNDAYRTLAEIRVLDDSKQ